MQSNQCQIKMPTKFHYCFFTTGDLMNGSAKLNLLAIYLNLNTFIIN